MKLYQTSATGRLEPTSIKHRFSRIVRFVQPDALPDGIACSFDADKNVLRINQTVYDALGERDQLRLFRSRETLSFT